MAGYQFGHIATFSLKGNSLNFSIDDVAAEAARQPGAHPHVDEPLPPTVIAGAFQPEDVPDEIRRRVREAKAALRGVRTADGKIQRIRNDTHVMEAQVHSHPIYTKPPPPDHEGEVRPHMEDPKERDRYLRWRSDLVERVYADAKLRGLEVLCVVEHVDEAHPHVHALMVPLRTQSNPRMDAKVTHPGHAAAQRRKDQAMERLKATAPAGLPEPEPESEPTERKRTRRRRGSDIGRRAKNEPKARKGREKRSGPATAEEIVTQLGMRAYKAAMRQWQGDLYRSVSVRHGLARVGPGLERLTRRAWWQRQNQNDAVVVLNENLKLAELSGNRFVEKVTAATAAADAAEGRQKDAQTKADDAERRLEALKAAEAAALESISRAEMLPEKIAGLEAEEALARQRLADMEADVAAAELKVKKAADAETAREAAELAAADAERRRVEAETAASMLQAQAKIIQDERAKIGAEWAALEERAKTLDAKAQGLDASVRGLGAWASGRLRLTDEGELMLREARNGRDINEELRSFKPAQAWLVNAVTRLEKIFNSRLARSVEELKLVVASTVRAWSSGLIYSREDGKLAVRDLRDPEATERFLEVTSGHPEVVQSVFATLPDLTVVNDVRAKAEEARAILTEAEDRHVRNTLGATRGLGGRGSGRP